MTRSNLPLYSGELYDTPVGNLLLICSDAGLVAVEWAHSRGTLDRYLRRLRRSVHAYPAKIAPYAAELREYLNCRRREFSFPIDWNLLRPFQRSALELVYAIPYGETRTYGQIALELGRPKASRAVGRANATNPMPLVIPCHRLIGGDGKLHGYGGGEGLATKEWLLKMEGAVIA
jgi:methylated-DNA-[protein]-cysteine S-methyltransferase